MYIGKILLSKKYSFVVYHSSELTWVIEIVLSSLADDGVTGYLTRGWDGEVTHGATVDVVGSSIIVILVGYLKQRTVQIHGVWLSEKKNNYDKHG